MEISKPGYAELKPIIATLYDLGIQVRIIYLKDRLEYCPTEMGKKVYFMSCGDFCKIGIAAVPENRVRQVETHNPIPVTVEVVMEPIGMTARNLEMAIHERLSEMKARGEWFEGEVLESFDYFKAAQ